jgi:hypothetical protein
MFAKTLLLLLKYCCLIDGDEKELISVDFSRFKFYENWHSKIFENV